MSIKYSIRNRTRDLPVCSVVPQPGASPRAHTTLCMLELNSTVMQIAVTILQTLHTHNFHSAVFCGILEFCAQANEFNDILLPDIDESSISTRRGGKEELRRIRILQQTKGSYIHSYCNETFQNYYASLSKLCADVKNLPHKRRIR